MATCCTQVVHYKSRTCIAVQAGGLDEEGYTTAEAIERQAEILSLWQTQVSAKCMVSAAVCAALRGSVVNSEPCHGFGLPQKNLLDRNKGQPNRVCRSSMCSCARVKHVSFIP
jgi:hypothetical protein